MHPHYDLIWFVLVVACRVLVASLSMLRQVDVEELNGKGIGPVPVLLKSSPSRL